jgi:hypothetical protein
MEYFGEKTPLDFACGHCDNDTKAEGNPILVPAMNIAEPWAADTPGDGVGLEPDFEPGEEVAHETFGRGIVLAVEGDRIEMDFGGHGIRTVRRDFLAR